MPASIIPLKPSQAFNTPFIDKAMESLNKKTTAGISFASAAAGGASKPTVASAVATATPTTTTSGQAKNGGATTTGTGAGAVTSSPALGSQSPAPSGATESNTSTATITATTTATSNANNGAIDWVLGMNVKVVTLADEVYEGQVFAYDMIMNCVVLHIKLVSPLFLCFFCRWYFASMRSFPYCFDPPTAYTQRAIMGELPRGNREERDLMRFLIVYFFLYLRLTT
jgi:small nuclear ribonucleoprotein (snRNP)-like protein